VTVEVLLWTVISLGIAGMTLWGNIEYWRRRRRQRPAVSSDISAFSPTIDDCASRPLIEPGGLEIRRGATPADPGEPRP
jgi:hypothetical protein